MRSNSLLIAATLLCGATRLEGQDTTQVRETVSGKPSPASPLDSARALTRIVVRAAKPKSSYAPRASAATRLDLPLRDVPQSVTVIARELLTDQSAQNMTDVVRYIPGITMGQGEGHRDAPTIRGNSSTADFFVDGVRDDAQYLRDLYNVDRVEALKGSNAMVFGRGGGGGVLNRVTKEAKWAPVRAIGYETGSFRHHRATADVGDAMSATLALRVNGMLEGSGDFRDATSLRRHGINPTAALLARGTLLRVGYERFVDERTVNRGLPSFRGRPSEADIHTFFGDPTLNRSRVAVDAATATVERGSLDRVMIRNRSRFASYDKFYRNILPGAVNQAGTQVSLSGYLNAIDRTNLFNQTDITFARGSGSVRSAFLAGAEVGRQITNSYRATGFFNGNSTTLVVPFDQPTVSAPVEFRQSATDADSRTTAGVSAAYAQTQLALGPHWQTIAGLRVERFEVLFHDHRTGRELFRADRMLSPRYGLVFKPVESVSIYGNNSISFLPSSGDQFGSLTPTTRNLEPERFANHEAGMKWDLPSGLALTGAIYRLERSNSAAPDPANPARVVQTGKQRTTGAEAGVSGSITGRWEVAGGYAWQRATLTSRTNAAKAGAAVPLVPYYTFSLWNRYRATDWLAGGLGVIRQDEMYAAIDNAVTLPAFTRLDAALFVTPQGWLRAQINVENLLNTRYYPTSHGNNNILPGAPRSVRLSVTATP